MIRKKLLVFSVIALLQLTGFWSIKSDATWTFINCACNPYGTDNTDTTITVTWYPVGFRYTETYNIPYGTAHTVTKPSHDSLSPAVNNTNNITFKQSSGGTQQENLTAVEPSGGGSFIVVPSRSGYTLQSGTACPKASCDKSIKKMSTNLK